MAAADLKPAIVGGPPLYSERMSLAASACTAVRAVAVRPAPSLSINVSALVVTSASQPRSAAPVLDNVMVCELVLSGSWLALMLSELTPGQEESRRRPVSSTP